MPPARRDQSCRGDRAGGRATSRTFRIARIVDSGSWAPCPAGCSPSSVSSVLVAAVDVGLVLVARGNHAAAANPSGVVAVIDPGDARVVARIDVGAQPTVDGRRLRRRLGAEQGRGHGDAHRRAFTAKSSRRSTRTRRANGLTVGAGGVWFAGPRARGQRPARRGEARAHRPGDRRRRPDVRDAHRRVGGRRSPERALVDRLPRRARPRRRPLRCRDRNVAAGRDRHLRRSDRRRATDAVYYVGESRQAAWRASRRRQVGRRTS